MNHYEKTMRLDDADFKKIIGVKREAFVAMVEVLTAEYLKKHENGIIFINILCVELVFFCVAKRNIGRHKPNLGIQRRLIA